MKRRTFLGATTASLAATQLAGPAHATSPTASPTAAQYTVVARFWGSMPTGVTVSRHGRIFVNFPRWGDDVPFTVAELRHGKPVAYPNAEVNREDTSDLAGHFQSVQSVVVDPADRLWILDTGNPLFAGSSYGGPKLVAVDLRTDRIVRKILFPPEVVPSNSYPNDVRFDLRRGAEGMAFITDSGGTNGVIVVDLATGRSWRRLAGQPSALPDEQFLPIIEGEPLMIRPADGEPMHYETGSDGIALSADGKRLYYCPLSSRRLHSVATDALADPDATEAEVAATVEDHGFKPMADGLESDDKGRLYGGDLEHNSIWRRNPDGTYHTLAQGTDLIWVDTLSVASDRHLYATAAQPDVALPRGRGSAPQALSPGPPADRRRAGQARLTSWAADALARGAVDELAAFRTRAPGMPYAHPTVDHYIPLFITPTGRCGPPSRDTRSASPSARPRRPGDTDSRVTTTPNQINFIEETTMTEATDRIIDALRSGHNHLAAVVQRLTAADLTRPSGASEWDVSQVLSHLGSGAEIGLAALEGATGGTGAPDGDFNKSVWARWDAMTPAERAEGLVTANQALVERYEGLDAGARSDLRIDLGFLPAPVDVATAAGILLSELTHHSWDVEVAFDPSTTLASAATGPLLDQAGMKLGFLGKADALENRPVAVAVHTTAPERAFGLSIGETVALTGEPENADAVLTAPAEWWLRLITGRHAPAHTPPSVTLTGDTVTLDDLRRVFPGF